MESANGDELLGAVFNLRSRYGDHYSKAMAEILPDDGGAVIGLTAEGVELDRYVGGRSRYKDNLEELLRSKKFKSEDDLEQDLSTAISNLGIPEASGKERAKTINDSTSAAKMIYADLVMRGVEKKEAAKSAMQLLTRDMQYGHGIAVNNASKVSPDQIHFTMAGSWSKTFLQSTISSQGEGVMDLLGDGREAFFNTPVLMQSTGNSMQGQPYIKDIRGNRHYFQTPEGKLLTVPYSVFDAPDVRTVSAEGVGLTDFDPHANSLNAILRQYGKKVTYTDEDLRSTGRSFLNSYVQKGFGGRGLSTERRSYKLEDIVNNEIDVLEDFE